MDVFARLRQKVIQLVALDTQREERDIWHDAGEAPAGYGHDDKDETWHDVEGHGEYTALVPPALLKPSGNVSGQILDGIIEDLSNLSNASFDGFVTMLDTVFLPGTPNHDHYYLSFWKRRMQLDYEVTFPGPHRGQVLPIAALLINHATELQKPLAAAGQTFSIRQLTRFIEVLLSTFVRVAICHAFGDFRLYAQRAVKNTLAISLRTRHWTHNEQSPRLQIPAPWSPIELTEVSVHATEELVQHLREKVVYNDEIAFLLSLTRDQLADTRKVRNLMHIALLWLSPRKGTTGQHPSRRPSVTVSGTAAYDVFVEHHGTLMNPDDLVGVTDENVGHWEVACQTDEQSFRLIVRSLLRILLTLRIVGENIPVTTDNYGQLSMKHSEVVAGHDMIASREVIALAPHLGSANAHDLIGGPEEGAPCIFTIGQTERLCSRRGFSLAIDYRGPYYQGERYGVRLYDEEIVTAVDVRVLLTTSTTLSHINSVSPEVVQQFFNHAQHTLSTTRGNDVFARDVNDRDITSYLLESMSNNMEVYHLPFEITRELLAHPPADATRATRINLLVAWTRVMNALGFALSYRRDSRSTRPGDSDAWIGGELLRQDMEWPPQKSPFERTAKTIYYQARHI